MLHRQCSFPKLNSFQFAIHVAFIFAYRVEQFSRNCVYAVHCELRLNFWKLYTVQVNHRYYLTANSIRCAVEYINYYLARLDVLVFVFDAVACWLVPFRIVSRSHFESLYYPTLWNVLQIKYENMNHKLLYQMECEKQISAFEGTQTRDG